MMRITLVFIWAIFFISCSKNNTSQEGSNDEDFSFIFMTDIHLQPKHKYPNIPQTIDFSPHKAFSVAIDTANKLGAAFAIMGGDQVYDVMRGQVWADSLFQDYKNAVASLNMPVYHTIGNHELYGIYKEDGAIKDHPDYKYGMFERYFGKTYYSFDYQNWHFIILNSLDVEDNRYIGVISEEQINWLRQHLSEIDPKTPIVVSTHLPLISVMRQIHSTNTLDNKWINNRDELLDLFSGHNLKLVLQGHIHMMEDIYIHQSDIHFITGGSIAGRPTWQGFSNGKSGFLHIKIKEQDISWDFIDFGWHDYIKNIN